MGSASNAHVSELKAFAEQFNLVVAQLERSNLAEIRNGLDHFREEDKFPTLEKMIACERRLAEAIDIADLNRFIPKVHWLNDSKKDEFGMEEYALQDYGGRKLVLNGPAGVSGLKSVRFSTPLIIPYGNLLGQTNSELVFYLVEESPYSRMWANYPSRRSYRADHDQQSDAATDVIDTTRNEVASEKGESGQPPPHSAA